MSSGEAYRFSADETNQNGMLAWHCLEIREALHLNTISSRPQLSGGMEHLSEKRVKALRPSQGVCTGLPLPRVSDPSCSQKCPARLTMKSVETRRVEWSWPVWGSTKQTVVLGVKSYTQPFELWPCIFLGTAKKGEEDWWRVPRAYTDITFLLIISLLWHIIAGREAAWKTDFINQTREKKCPDKLLCTFVSFSYPCSFPFPPVSITFLSLIPLLLSLSSLPLPTFFPVVSPKHPHRDSALFRDPQKHPAPLDPAFKYTTAVFQWPGWRDFGITALPPFFSESHHFFQTDYRSWEHPQPYSHPETLGTGAERRDDPVLIAEGMMLFRKDCQELPLTASDTGFCP